jgi:two-component sensor histidine kinase
MSGGTNDAKLRTELENLRRELTLANARYDELQHRVRNEFQLFLSSFNAQERKAHTPSSCVQCISRMWSVAALHQTLDSSSSLLDMVAYLQSISESFSKAFPSPINFAISVQPNLYLDTRSAMVIGQFFCEAAMNAIKHGFPDGSSGHVVTHLRSFGNNFELIVGNDGMNLDLKTVPPNGFHALKDIASQMNGELHVEPMHEGMQVRLTFSI